MQSYPKITAGKHLHPKKRVELVVRARPGNPQQGLLWVEGRAFPCALGRSGIRAIKREGDGATPLGRMRLVDGWYRSRSTGTVRTPLPMQPIRLKDGWCDASDDRNYNRPVRLPYTASHERMLRDDRLYDRCLVLDYNIRPRRRGMGSAIFLHIARPGYRPTEGCVALSPRDMSRLLPYLARGTVLRVVR